MLSRALPARRSALHRGPPARAVLALVLGQGLKGSEEDRHGEDHERHSKRHARHLPPLPASAARTAPAPLPLRRGRELRTKM
jgi:hypothetical protein